MGSVASNPKPDPDPNTSQQTISPYETRGVSRRGCYTDEEWKILGQRYPDNRRIIHTPCGPRGDEWKAKLRAVPAALDDNTVKVEMGTPSGETKPETTVAKRRTPKTQPEYTLYVEMDEETILPPIRRMATDLSVSLEAFLLTIPDNERTKDLLDQHLDVLGTSIQLRALKNEAKETVTGRLRSSLAMYLIRKYSDPFVATKGKKSVCLTIHSGIGTTIDSDLLWIGVQWVDYVRDNVDWRVRVRLVLKKKTDAYTDTPTFRDVCSADVRQIIETFAREQKTLVNEIQWHAKIAPNVDDTAVKDITKELNTRWSKRYENFGDTVSEPILISIVRR